MWALLRALPTKADIESLINRLETQHRKDIQEVRGEQGSLNTRLTAGAMDLERKVMALDRRRRRGQKTWQIWQSSADFRVTPSLRSWNMTAYTTRWDQDLLTQTDRGT